MGLGNTVNELAQLKLLRESITLIESQRVAVRRVRLRLDVFGIEIHFPGTDLSATVAETPEGHQSSSELEQFRKSISESGSLDLFIHGMHSRHDFALEDNYKAYLASNLEELNAIGIGEFRDVRQGAGGSPLVKFIPSADGMREIRKEYKSMALKSKSPVRESIALLEGATMHISIQWGQVSISFDGSKHLIHVLDVKEFRQLMSGKIQTISVAPARAIDRADFNLDGRTATIGEYERHQARVLSDLAMLKVGKFSGWHEMGHESGVVLVQFTPTPEALHELRKLVKPMRAELAK